MVKKFYIKEKNMKKMKRYGVVEPKALDYLLAAAFALLAISSLWISIWITVTKNYALTVESLKLFVNVMVGKFGGTYKWLILVQSVLLWTGAVCSLLILFASAIAKKPRAIAGAFALLLIKFTFLCEVDFLVLFFNSGIYGLFIVFLAVFMILELMLSCCILKHLKKQAKGCEVCEKNTLKVAEKEESKPEVKEEKQPYISTLEVYEKATPEEVVDLEFENSNDYRSYMYHDAVAKYIENEEPKPAEEPKVEEQKPVEKPKEVKPQVKKVEKKPEDTSFMKSKANNFTFEQKLANSKQVVRDYFEELKKDFEGLGFKYAVTKQGATFSVRNNKYAQITTTGLNGLKIYFKLDVKDYADSKIPVKDASGVRKYENVPLVFVVKSDLAVKRAKLLMRDVKVN